MKLNGQDNRDLHALTEAILKMPEEPDTDPAATEPPTSLAPQDEVIEHGSADSPELVPLVTNNAPNVNGRSSPLRASTERAWPSPLAEEGFYGLAGEMVRTIEPHSEADPAAILIQLLIAFGNVAGRNVYFRVGADAHYMNLYGVVVGETAKGRKGASWSVVLQQLGSCDSTWAGSRIASGLSTGEGLIWAVRDPIEELEPVKDPKTKKIIDYQKKITDEGESDKRLLVVEPEFSRVLKAAEREANTLSDVLRQGWESGNLRVLTRSRPVRATEAHISLIGHITRAELMRNLATTEMANGFCNRDLWICSKRSKLLPDGGELHKVNMGALRSRLSEALELARNARELTRDEEASELWHDVYSQLSGERPGLFGAVTSRAEAQVLRLSCLYALLDRSPVVGMRHLVAALAVWQYCEESARYIFGDSLGDTTADLILNALRAAPSGITRTGISDLFDRKKAAAEITRALGVLESQHKARCEREGTAGRTAERWFAV
jgi:hypothetical protein